MPLNTYKAIVFDMDGVLVNTSPAHAMAYAELWAKLDISAPDYVEIAGRGTKDVIKERTDLSVEDQSSAVAFKQRRALDFLQTADVSFPDTEESLKKLASVSMPMVVATSASSGSANLVLDRLSLKQYFKTIFNVSDVANPKPAPDLFNKAIKYLGFEQCDILIVEDSDSGLQAALATGADVVSLRQQPQNLEQKNYIGHFKDLKSLVAELMGA